MNNKSGKEVIIRYHICQIINSPEMKTDESSTGSNHDTNLVKVPGQLSEPWYRHPVLSVIRKGALLTLPVLIFITLIYLLSQLIFSLLAPITMLLAPNVDVTPWYMHLLSLLILLGFFLLVGWLQRNGAITEMAGKLERKYLHPLPFYTVIHDMVQQFGGLKKMPFTQVVLVDPYGNGVYLTGFVSEEVHPDLFTIFVPTAPNPLNGNLYHVPRSNLIFLKISPDVAMRTIVGMGNGSSYLFTDVKSGVTDQEVIEKISA